MQSSRPRRKSGNVRKVYYTTKQLARVTPIAAAMLEEDVSEFIVKAILDRIDARFSAEQRQVLFHSQPSA